MEDCLSLFQDGLFKGLAPDEAEAFLSRCRRKTYPDGTLLFREMTDATVLYLPVSGIVELLLKLPGKKGDKVLATRRPGDAVGWSSVVPPYQYRFSGICRGETTVFEIDRHAMHSLFATNYHLGYIFMRNIAVLSGDRLLHVQEKLAKAFGDEEATGW